jgi:hypothetical protein
MRSSGSRVTSAWELTGAQRLAASLEDGSKVEAEKSVPVDGSEGPAVMSGTIDRGGSSRSTPLQRPRAAIRPPTHVGRHHQPATTGARCLTARWRYDRVATGHKAALAGPVLVLVLGCPVKRVSGPLACGLARV